MNFTFYQIYWIFILYAFIGWCGEVAYATIKTGKFINRGFLNGPVCPIYGFGMVIVTLLLMPIRHNILILFVGAVLFTSVLEFVTGFILEKFFHHKWWDYSDRKWNIKGYICPQFSLLWGTSCVVVIAFLQPSILSLINLCPKLLGIILLGIVSTILITDFSITVSTILKINAHFERLNETEARLRKISDELGEGISKKVGAGIQLYEKHIPELESVKVRLEALLNEKHFGVTRLKKAFPNLNIITKERERISNEKLKILFAKIKRNEPKEEVVAKK